jgi:acyl-CoA dehydrogenase
MPGGGTLSSISSRTLFMTTATPQESDEPFMVSLESQDYSELRDAVRRICRDYPGDYWRKLDNESAYPTEFVRALNEAGFLGALIPEEYGGSGMPLRAAAVILEEINASGCVASAAHAQMYIMGTLLRHGSEEQKRRYLPGIASGELRLQAFGVTEPTSGSDTTQLKTRAVRKGDVYVVNGQKVWTSRALHSDLMLLLVRTTPLEECRKKTDGLSTLLVDLRTAKGNGIEIRPIAAMINHNTTEVFIENLEVPVANLVGEEGKGFRYILDGMNAERILVAQECIGDGRWLLKKAVDYASERQVFGRPIGQNQGIQFPLARAYMELEAADLMARKAAALFEAGKPCGAEANMAKLLASEATWHAADTAMQTHGGFGFAQEYDVERKWREVRIYQTAPISTNLILGYLGEHVLGLPRSY